LAGAVWAAPAADEPTFLFDKQLSAKIPSGLYNLAQQAIDADYKAPNRPQHVFRNQLGDYSVAFLFMAKKVAPSELPVFQTNLKEAFLKKMDGVQWLGNKTRKIHGVEWFELEFKNLEANGNLMHNWILGTSWKGRLLEVTINAFDDVEPQLGNSVEELVQSLTFVSSVGR